MNILLLGGSGQVGFELQRTLAALGSVLSPDRNKLDLMGEEAVSGYLAENKPDIIVNAAAWTAVDAAEEKQKDSERLNSGLPAQLADYAAKNDARLIHYSSDYVYPGNGEQPWHEESPPGPKNYYGKTKLAGDQAIENSGADYLIFRTSWVYSARGNNFMKTMFRLAENKSELNIVADQIGAPTPARLIAQITSLAIHSRLVKGLYHLSPKGEVSWCGFAALIFSKAKEAGVKLTINPEKVCPVLTVDYPTIATRPLNSRLAVCKLEQALSIQLPTWQSQLELTLNEYLEK
ncbi:dTDP-4-dehydrorhamnose reductase [Amphritea balenae]|uniref:dTDP-4-dehydrorhamnose reductase n=1 Tax=Amphritea balenae TaxID=452629 RepID=A0A3P1SQE1_9GAMM|nr:dTDP-4-dehydrorhamnose reductase [Amphritea balenae]RRC99194.1 dTDP-4-dehydrorhamnose reductase [Amphritea balenae]GGK73175.1 NAD(P)-dependent oxidoreductase [Amphritea balenae]